MKKIILIAFAGILSFSVLAQAREESKKERKAREWQIEKSELLEMINDSSFVLNAHRYYNRYHNQQQLTSDNFIAINGDQIVIQTSNPFGMGYNGMGGITLEGTISDYDVIKGKEKHAPKVRINFTNSVLGHSTLFLTLTRNNTTARLTDNWGRRNTWAGPVVDPKDVFNFQGMSFR